MVYMTEGAMRLLPFHIQKRNIKKRPKIGLFLLCMKLLLGVEERVERLHQLIRIDAVHRAGVRDRFRRGVRAVEAVHAERHENRRNFGIEATQKRWSYRK